MKKLLLTSSALVFLLLSCNPSKEGSTSKTNTTDSLQTAVVYECPMKCEGKTYDKPGNCTVCGMELIVKK